MPTPNEILSNIVLYKLTPEEAMFWKARIERRISQKVRSVKHSDCKHYTRIMQFGDIDKCLDIIRITYDLYYNMGGASTNKNILMKAFPNESPKKRSNQYIVSSVLALAGFKISPARYQGQHVRKYYPKKDLKYKEVVTEKGFSAAKRDTTREVKEKVPNHKNFFINKFKNAIGLGSKDPELSQFI